MADLFNPEDDGVVLLNRGGTIAKLDSHSEEERLAFGWFYKAIDPDGTVRIDKQGDFVDDAWELEQAAYDFVLHSRSGDEMHLQVPVADLVESVVFTPEKVAKMGLPEGVIPTGWWGGFKVRDDRVWDTIQSGGYGAFSVGGSGIRERVED